MDRPPHNIETLLTSYNRNCPDCRLMVLNISEGAAARLLAAEAARIARSRRPARIRLQNAIAIWQSAVKRNMKRGR